MRNSGEFVRDVATKSPLALPLVGLFHILWLCWTLWSDRMEPFPDVVWLQALWLAGYTFFWIWACDMKKKGATGYISLTVIDLIIYLAARNHLVPAAYVSNIFSIDVLFSLGLLYYFGKME